MAKYTAVARPTLLDSTGAFVEVTVAVGVAVANVGLGEMTAGMAVEDRAVLDGIAINVGLKNAVMVKFGVGKANGVGVIFWGSTQANIADKSTTILADKPKKDLLI